jgi:hypothetical protein
VVRGYGDATADRANSRNGFRRWDQDTRAGTFEPVIRKLRTAPPSGRPPEVEGGPAGRGAYLPVARQGRMPRTRPHRIADPDSAPGSTGVTRSAGWHDLR